MKLPRSYGSRVYLAQLIAVAVGLVFLLLGWWRPGVGLIAASFVVAATARAVISDDHVGMLGVRGRIFDITWMSVLGVSLGVLAIIVPNSWT